MLIPISTVNKDVIKVHHHEFAKERPQHLVHQSHESARCVSKPKWHHKPLVQPMLHFESCLPFIPFSHSNMVVATSQINFGKHMWTTQFIKHVIKPWNWKPILDINIINSPTINTHTPTTIFFRDQKSRNNTRTHRLTHISHTHQLIYLALHSLVSKGFHL